MLNFIKTYKLYVLTIIFTVLLTFSFYYVKQEDITMLWGNGFGVAYILMWFFGNSLIISLTVKI